MPKRTIYWRDPDGTQSHYRTDSVWRAKRFKATLRAAGATILQPVYRDGLLTGYVPTE